MEWIGADEMMLGLRAVAALAEDHRRLAGEFALRSLQQPRRHRIGPVLREQAFTVRTLFSAHQPAALGLMALLHLTRWPLLQVDS